MTRRQLRLSLLAALLAFTPVVSAAEPGEFAARLLRADGRPAAHYSISVVGLPLATVTGEDGRFRLAPSPTPPFSIVAASPEGDVEAPLEVLDLATSELRLHDVVRDVVTVVSGVAPSLEALPGSAASVLTREELEQRAPQRLYQALESIAGASRLGDGADSVPALRNLGRGRTLVLIDGARVTAERRAGPSATFVDPATLANVEVLRGPGSVIYGSDAFGGVLNAVTADPEPGAPWLRYGLEGGFEAVPERAAFASASLGWNDHGLLIEGHGRDADEVRAGGGGEIFNSSYASWGAALRYALQTRRGRLRAGFALDDVDDLGKAAIDSRAIRARYPRERSRRLTASWIGAPAGAWDATEAALFFGEYDVVLDRDRAPTATSNRRIDRADTSANDASLRLLAGRELAGGRLQLGIDASSRFDLRSDVAQIRYAGDGTTVTDTTVTPSIDDARQTASGAFATWARPLAPRLSLGLGARGDRIQSRNRGGHFGDRSLSREALSGNVSLTAGPFAGWTTTLQAARGFRSPTLSDRFFRGPSGRGFVTGNPDLDPETSLQVDLSARWRQDRTAVGFFAYRYRIDDLIERYGAGSDFFFRNRGQAVIEGIEAEAQTGFANDWTLEAGAALSRGRTDGGATIDDIAPANGWITVRRSFGRWFGYLRLAGAVRHDEPGPNELERPAYTLLDGGGGVRFSDRLELRLAVRNAGDRRYTAAPDNAADLAAGRGVTLSLSGRL